MLADIDRLVQERADELTPELLPMLLERFLGREGVVDCERHGKHLLPYVNAQITLTRIRRDYYRDWGTTSEVVLNNCVKRRDEVRARYRATPCTCWVQHR